MGIGGGLLEFNDDGIGAPFNNNNFDNDERVDDDDGVEVSDIEWSTNDVKDFEFNCCCIFLRRDTGNSKSRSFASSLSVLEVCFSSNDTIKSTSDDDEVS
jgi:hypothetical protein